MYYLETSKPSAPGSIHLVRATVQGLELSWQGVPTADSYILQLQKCDPQPENSNSFYIIFCIIFIYILSLLFFTFYK